MSKFLHKPLNTKSLPKGIPYIILNEAAERFSFYGMKGILVIYMTKYLFLETGEANLSEENAKAYFHLFTSAVYFFPIIGALISDIFLGKYKTIILLSLVYCLGHLTLAIDPSKFGLSVGLTLIAIGSGGIKPCVSAHLGDQFGKNNLENIKFLYDISNGSPGIAIQFDDKVLVMGSVTGAPPTPVAGGLYYSGSDDWFLGYEN